MHRVELIYDIILLFHIKYQIYEEAVHVLWSNKSLPLFVICHFDSQLILNGRVLLHDLDYVAMFVQSHFWPFQHDYMHNELNQYKT